MAISGFGRGISLLAFPQDGVIGEVLTVTALAPDFDFDWLPAGGGIAGITIEDEGVPLATLADTLDFVGGGVTAAGAGTTKTITIPLGAGGTLQTAYDAAPAIPQISVNAAQPVTIDLGVAANDVFLLRDAANADILRVSDTLATLTGAELVVDGALEGGALASLRMLDTYTETGVFIGGGIVSAGTITVTNAVWIWALLQESKRYEIGVNPGFAAFTMFNALSTIANSGNFNLVAGLILNAGLAHERNTGGTSTYVGTTVISSSPQSRTTIAGAILTETTGDTGIRHAKTFNTVAVSSVAMGTQRGLHFANPAVALFGTQAGIETATALIAVDVDALPFGGTIVKAAVRSNIVSATNSFFLLNNNTAPSEFGSSTIHFNDLFGPIFGNSNDVSMGWSGAANEWFLQFNALVNQYRISNPASGRFLFDSPLADHEFNFNCNRFSLGAQTGAVGNQIGVFVAPAITVTIGGEFTQFLLTQAGSVTADAALGLVAAWTVNAPSIVIGAGSVTQAGVLNVGGNVTEGSVDRFGIRVLSNPAGGSGINAALWITAGLSRFDGRVDINNGIALGGGAAATLGTIGGAGPTAAAQAQWMEVDIGGVAHWVAVWT